MSDIALQRAFRRWSQEETEESRDNALRVASRHGIDIWGVFLRLIEFETLFLAQEAKGRTFGLVHDYSGAMELMGDLLAKLETGSRAQVAISTADGYIEGDEYCIGYIDYKNPGDVYLVTSIWNVYDKTAPSPLWNRQHDKDIVAEIREQKAKDLFILQARDWLVIEMSEGDEILEGIYKMHIRYNSGEIDDPDIYQGVPFWPVGRNASHEFYLGVSNGQRYRMSEGYEYDDAGIGGNVRSSRPVEDFHGYMGHF
jgi:hypothetical protein